MEITDFRELDVWQVSMAVAEDVYRLASRLPATERYELSSQIRRAAVSIPSNIAEGHSTRLATVYRKHARLALGSVGELSTQLELACRFGFITRAERDPLERQLVRTRDLLGGVVRSMTRRIEAGLTTIFGALVLLLVL